jgi:hypothetical protein
MCDIQLSSAAGYAHTNGWEAVVPLIPIRLAATRLRLAMAWEAARRYSSATPSLPALMVRLFYSRSTYAAFV